MVKAPSWRIIAIAILMAGILGGCQGSRITELEQELAAVTKECDALKAERDSLVGEVSELRNEEQAAQALAESEIEKLRKENEGLKARLAAQ